MGRRIFSRIIIAVCIVALMALVALIAKDHVDEKKRAARMEKQYDKVNEKINALYQKRDALNDAIEIIKEDMRITDENLATVTYIFASPESELVEQASDILTKQSLKANVAVSSKKFPGDKGCISIDRMRRLTDAGWEIIINQEKASDISEVCDKLNEAGLPMATAVYIDDADNIESVLSLMSKYDINVIFDGSDAGLEVGGDFVTIPVFGYRTNGIKNQTVELINNSETLALTIGEKEENDVSTGIEKIADPYDDEVFTNMITIVGQHTEKDECKVTGAEEAGRRCRKHKTISDDAFENAGSKIERIESEIEEINAEIRELHAGSA